MVEYDPFSDEVLDNPLPVYKRLRDEAPAYFVEKYNAWAISRFQDIWDYSSHPAFSTSKGTTPSQLLTKVQPVTPMLNLIDPPEHTRLRAQLKPFFLPKRARALEPVARQIVKDCLEKALARGECDVMGDFASQLSVKIACTAIGIPLEHTDNLNDLVWRFFARDPEIDGMTEDGLAAAQELIGYLVNLCQERRKSSLDHGDVIDMFCSYETAEGRLFADEEVASHLSMLVIGGSETFPKTFANALWRLWQHKDQRAELAKDPSLIPDAYQEILRYDMPTQFLGRTLLDDVEIQGQKLHKGQVVLFLYPSANRDEREFDDPDAFNVHRRPPRILTFGAGTHMCLGLHVAKMEARVGLEETLTQIPEYEVDIDRAERLRTEFVQGFASLPITF